MSIPSHITKSTLRQIKSSSSSLAFNGSRLNSSTSSHSLAMKKRFLATSNPSTGTTAASTGATKSAEKVSIPPPPPSGKSSTSGSGGGGSNGIFILAAIAAGAGYYFKDDILKQLGMGTQQATPKKAEAPAAVESSPKESKPVAVTPAPTPAPAPAPAPAPVPVPVAVAAPAKEVPSAPIGSSSKAAEDLKKDVETVARHLQAAKDIAAGKTPVVDLKEVRQAIADILEDEKYDDGSYGPLFIRLAWHASGTYDKNTQRGGSDGATMRFAGEADWGANAGLHIARSKLEPIKAKFPGLTYADLWILAGSVAIEEMGGPKINFRLGRKDATVSSNLPDGLLPDADGRDKKANPADHLRDIFYRQGFNDQEIVALSGAHALGRCHPDRSGFWGPWTRAPTTFSNEYFKLILEEEWKEKKTHQGKPWTGPFQYEDKTGELMMLPTDLALAQDPKMRAWVEKYAKDEKLFFDDFAKAWIKLTENGVRRFHGTRRYYFFGPRE